MMVSKEWRKVLRTLYQRFKRGLLRSFRPPAVLFLTKKNAGEKSSKRIEKNFLRIFYTSFFEFYHERVIHKKKRKYQRVRKKF